MIWPQWPHPKLSCPICTSGSGYFLSNTSDAAARVNVAATSLALVAIDIKHYPRCSISVKNVLEIA